MAKQKLSERPEINRLLTSERAFLTGSPELYLRFCIVLIIWH